MTTYITIEDGPGDADVYPVDTLEEIEAAQAALRDAGLDAAPVYAGDPDCPDSYANGRVLFANDNTDETGAMAEMLADRRDFACGNEAPEDVAEEWSWTSPEVAEKWLDARCFDGASARLLDAEGVTPEQAATSGDVCGYTDSVGYAVANGDMSIDDAREAIGEVD